ncbi:MAG: response regulator [Bacteroidota bacterium]|jgi:CheY-like chemotaxis protein
MDDKLEFFVMDDDEIFIYLIKSVLERSSYASAVHVFTSTPEALSWIYARVDRGEKLPDLMIVDIRMPLMSGIDLLEKISKLPEKSLKGTKACMLTSSLTESDKKASMAYPFVIDYINKPFSREKLNDLVAKYHEVEKAG